MQHVANTFPEMKNSIHVASSSGLIASALNIQVRCSLLVQRVAHRQNVTRGTSSFPSQAECLGDVCAHWTCVDTEVLIANPPLILEALQYRSGSETGTQCVEGASNRELGGAGTRERNSHFSLQQSQLAS